MQQHQGSQNLSIPFPPSRKPPKCTDSMKDRAKRRWKSMELLSGGRDVENSKVKDGMENVSSNHTASAAVNSNARQSGIKDQSILPVKDCDSEYNIIESSFLRRQSADLQLSTAEPFYNQVSDEYSKDDDANGRTLQPIRSSLSASCPHIVRLGAAQQPPEIPPRPKRPNQSASAFRRIPSPNSKSNDSAGNVKHLAGILLIANHNDASDNNRAGSPRFSDLQDKFRQENPKSVILPNKPQPNQKTYDHKFSKPQVPSRPLRPPPAPKTG